MKHFNQKNIIIALLIIVGLFILFSRTGCKDPVKPVVSNIKDDIKKIDTTLGSFKNRVEIIELENGNIEKSIEKVKPVLKKSQEKTKEIKKTSDLDTSKSINTASDYLDSLFNQSEYSDSVCNYYIELQNDQILNYQKIISVKDSSINYLEAEVKMQISERSIVEEYSKKLEKSLKRKKVFGKLKTATAIAAGIYAASLLLK